jgi:hypothetical protein
MVMVIDCVNITMLEADSVGTCEVCRYPIFAHRT